MRILKKMMRSLFLASVAFVFVLLSCTGNSGKSTAKSENVIQNSVSEADTLVDKAGRPIEHSASDGKNIVVPTNVVEEFYEAISDNDSLKVKEMLATNFPGHYQPGNKVSSLQALIWASDNSGLLKLFVEAGADIYGAETPLVVIAAEYGRLEIVRYLIEKGCDIKNNGAFNKAGFAQYYNVAKLLLLKGANQEIGDIRGKMWVFEQAVTKSDYDVLNQLNISDNEINDTNCYGETALIIAVKRSNPQMVKYLLQKNADKNKPETFDCTDVITYGRLPIEIAKLNDLKDIVALLEG